MASETIQQKTGEEKIAKCRISRCKVVENAFGILMCRFRVLLNTIEQYLHVGGIVLTLLCTHNILAIYQEGGAHPQNPQNDPAAINGYNYYWGRLKLQESLKGSTATGRPT